MSEGEGLHGYLALPPNLVSEQLSCFNLRLTAKRVWSAVYPAAAWLGFFLTNSAFKPKIVTLGGDYLDVDRC